MGNHNDGTNKSVTSGRNAQQTPEQQADNLLAEEKRTTQSKQVSSSNDANPIVGAINSISDLLHKVDEEGNKFFDKFSLSSLVSKPAELKSNLTEAKVLENAFKTFAENGLTEDEMRRLQSIDNKLTHTSLQIIKDGGAIITNDDGSSTKIPPKGGRKL